MKIFLSLDFNFIDYYFFLLLIYMKDHLNDINCKINYDLLMNCIIKSKDLNECYILKYTFNKFCYNKYNNYFSNK